MKKIINQFLKDFDFEKGTAFFFLIILIASILASRDLFKKGYFPMHDDLQVGRLYEMNLCFRDGQIPCRWVPDMGFSYGYPLFNYYPPFPFYLGQLFHLIGFSFIDSVKILFFLGFLASGILMFLLGSRLWGKWGGLLSSILYIWAPYHSVDVYVRGALNEFWAMSFLPGIFWAAYGLVENEKRKKFLSFFAFFFGMLLLSHNLMAFIFTPAIGTFTLLMIWLKKKNFLKTISDFFFASSLGLGLAAFFTLPVLLEKKYVHVETMLMGYFNYLAHFVPIGKMLLSIYWGYGSSGWLQEAGMPFQIGLIHWPLAFLVFVAFTILFFWKKAYREQAIIAIYFFVLFLFTLFLVHSRSVFIWNRLPLLAYLQFPWRFLTLVTFAISVLGGGLIFLIQNLKLKVLASLILSTVIIVFNFPFFKPEKIIKTNDTEKLFSSLGWLKLQTDAIFDYLPKSAKAPPASPAPNKPQILVGKGEITDVKKGTNWYSFKAIIAQESTIQIPIYYFPGWKVWVEGKEISITYDNDLGLITVSLLPGIYHVSVRLTNTTVRSLANLISLISWLVFFIFISPLQIPRQFFGGNETRKKPLAKKASLFLSEPEETPPFPALSANRHGRRGFIFKIKKRKK